LIDADALPHYTGYALSADEVAMAVENAPTIDPVRHGRWEVIDAEEPRRYGCSECKRLSWYMENYCPNCGAKMDEEENDGNQ
jgi:hypothetical protein